ncbi:reductase with broad range of substrate specificity [Jimgerdemannia flammicorona]|uniref:Reductase with broad range of substrate specificity n=2 Tax=Jimgerdemannia flammicorona TaxID=994334 RepID=A0A433BAK4_9FUNG|nr:reductase with broad range of substrate specificity [Jimgerdemannia flammicorona]RUS25393.1 reductase with broad range of substrate specificity [Jimgerdemannia flammicorona]
MVYHMVTNSTPNTCATAFSSSASILFSPLFSFLTQTAFINSMVFSQPANRNVLDFFSLRGKVVAITGGSRGIGLELSRGFAEAGADVANIYASSANSDAVAEEIRDTYGVRSKAYQADVANAEQVEGAIKQIVNDLGKLDVMVVNAGICTHVDSLDCTPEGWKHIQDVNVNGAFFTSQAAARVFKGQGYGNIIVIASISAHLVNRPQTQTSYNTSKAAVMHMTKCLAAEWASLNIRVNSISPGYISTDMTKMGIDEDPAMFNEWMRHTPAGRMAQPYELKGLAVFLASDASSYMTGSDIIVDGGYTVW